jgi:DNA-binding transcriptional MerR regulator
MSKRKNGSSQAAGSRPLKIGEAASQLNTSTRTLRFYEEQGILAPVRTAKGVRLYTDEDIELVRVAQHLTALGIALRDVAEIATVRSRSKTGDQSSHKVFALLEELGRDVEKKKKECDLVLEQIDAAARLVKQCFGCENPPTYLGCEKCPVTRNVAKSHLLRLIWDKDKPRVAS